MPRLKNKCCLITGGASGIGRAASRLFAEEKANVAIVDLEAEVGSSLADEINESGGNALFIRADVSNAGDVESAIAIAVNHFGRLDVLYNNAGGATANDGDICELPIDEFWRAISVNLFGTFAFCRFAIPHLERCGGGSIINTSSVRALIGTRGADAYTAAKGGVAALTRTLAMQLAGKNIRANAIAPGAILTERVQRLLDLTNPLLAKHVLGPGNPIDVAWLALFLASDESRLITGTVIPVDSGASAG